MSKRKTSKKIPQKNIVAGAVLVALLLFGMSWWNNQNPRIVTQSTIEQRELSAKPNKYDTLFDQALNPKLDYVEAVDTPYFSQKPTIPSNWLQTDDPEIGYTLYYPPTWTYHGEGRFCRQPDNHGSCQDFFPYDYTLPAEYGEYIPLSVSKIDGRVKVVPFGLGIDGVIISKIDKDDPTKFTPGVPYIRIGDKNHAFGLDLNDPDQKLMLSTLELQQ